MECWWWLWFKFGTSSFRKPGPLNRFHPKLLLTCLQSDGRRVVPMVSSKSSETVESFQNQVTMKKKQRYVRNADHNTHRIITYNTITELFLSYIAKTFPMFWGSLSGVKSKHLWSQNTEIGTAMQLPKPRHHLQIVIRQVEWCLRPTSTQVRLQVTVGNIRLPVTGLLLEGKCQTMGTSKSLRK